MGAPASTIGRTPPGGAVVRRSAHTAQAPDETDVDTGYSRYRVPVSQSLSICLPLVVAVVLIGSGIAKLRHSDDLAGWDQIGVPELLRRQWLLRWHPWGEIILGLAVSLLGGWPGVLAGLAAVALMGVYTVLIARVLTRPQSTSCACFGLRKQITRMTLVRNVWLLVLAVAAACAAWWTPTLGGAVRLAAKSHEWWWVLGIAIAAVTTWLVTRGDPADEQEPASSPDLTASGDGDGRDYLRTRTPAIPVTLADGTVHTLRELSTQHPLLVLEVSQTCGACQAVIARVGDYRRLLPEVTVRLLLGQNAADTALTETAEPQSLHDVQGLVSESFDGMWGTPAALLFGADGMMAGGPVVGAEEIDDLVHQMREELDS
ncbi:hypothetical protein C0Z10_13045 [Acidipropionibacterium jensenii]|uniref:Methylamine utilisation protein MauE domain-containing protein n=1 Tax=Acidipropionibacterium jensenii TaxID=1749 RepID=A0A3T0S2D5_9ACTN|nr:hypothetical protein C0Z10_13045 [Acidipropionibacterium jensenii]